MSGIVFPIMLRKLIPAVGFGWAVRILGFTSLATLAISITLIKQRLAPRPRGTFVEYKALGRPEFALYNAGMFLGFIGFFTFFDFVEEWAISIKLDTKGLPIVYILPVINAASIFGRMIPAFVADYTGPLNVQAPSLMIAGLLVLLWIPIHSIAPLLVVAILYGFSSGAAIALPPMSVSSMTKDMRTFGGMMGVMFLVSQFRMCDGLFRSSNVSSFEAESSKPFILPENVAFEQVLTSNSSASGVHRLLVHRSQAPSARASITHTTVHESSLALSWSQVPDSWVCPE